MCSPTFRCARARGRLFVYFAFFFKPHHHHPPSIYCHSAPSLCPSYYLPLLALAVSSALLFYSLAAVGQLINQIFKQCFSTQWEVLDYLWLLAVPIAATHDQPHPRLSSSSQDSLTQSLTSTLFCKVIFSHSQLQFLVLPP